MNPVVHFEMPYEDRERMAAFYSNAFGWKPRMMGPEMGSYVVAQTTETDEKGMIKTPGNINGGFFKRTKPEQVPSLVIAVPDIKAAVEKIKAAGGTVLPGMTGEFDDIPGVGLFCGFIDPEGNRVSMLQPKGM